MEVGFPFEIDDRGLVRGADYGRHIIEMIEQILFTVPGERVNRPEFGCGLLQLVFHKSSVELEAAAQLLVRSAIERWLGHLINVQSATVTVAEAGAELLVSLEYVIQATGEVRWARFRR